jgi:hypothetical protein
MAAAAAAEGAKGADAKGASGTGGAVSGEKAALQQPANSTTAKAARPPSRPVSARANLAIDAVAAVLYIIAANPLVTGWAVHEWASLGLVLVFAVHCAVHWEWLVATLRGRMDRASVANLALDIATLAAFMAVTVSGLAVSRVLLPFLGYVSYGYFLWAPVHAISAKLLLALLLVHVVVHWRWILARLPGRRRQKPADGGPSPEG